ncbi:hypothetical protein [Clostridium sp. LIBA-8841]|nr:hypothetical protein [Clostridium sp. LIBA-8841]MDZ5253824.1 hypothetical protein [Clostridium sp. LIBA-8841]
MRENNQKRNKEIQKERLVMKKAMDLVRVLAKVTFLGYDEKEDLK